MLTTIFIYIFITFVLSLAIVYLGNSIAQYTDNKNVKIVINWFTLLAILNVIIMMFIFASYNTLRFKPGPRGPPGRRGVIGSTGRDGSCVMCGPAINGLRPIRPLNKIDRIDAMHPDDERKELFPKDENVTKRDNKFAELIHNAYIQAFDYVNKLGYEQGLSYHIRQGLSRYYGLVISNDIKKHRNKLNIGQIQHRINTIQNTLHQRRQGIIDKMNHIRHRNHHDQNKIIENLIDNATYGHSV